MDTKTRIKHFLNNQLEGTHLFEVETTISTDGKRIIVTLDGDLLIQVADCSLVSRQLEAFIEAEKLAPEDYNLTVTSPGADKPLRILRQLPKHIGRTFRFVQNDGNVISGKLTDLSANNLIVESTIKEKGKKAVNQQLTLDFNSLKEARIVLEF